MNEIKNMNLNKYIKIDVFGKTIEIDPTGDFVKMAKLDTYSVNLISSNSKGESYTKPIFTKDFGKDADSFIERFNKLKNKIVK